MSRYCLFLLGMLLGLCFAAQAVEEISVLYNGEKQLPRRIAMGFWGYRPVNLTEGSPFVPFRLAANRRFYGLKIVSVGRYEGVRFDFLEPMDLSSFIADKDAFLEVYLRSTSQGPAMGPVVAPTARPQYMPNRPPGGMMPPGMYPGVNTPPGGPAGMYPEAALPPGAAYEMDETMPPMFDGYGGMPVAPPTAVEEPFIPEPEAVPGAGINSAERKPLTVPLPQLKNIRITFYTEKGAGMLVVTPDQFYPKEEINNFWVRIGIPLSQIRQGTPIGGKLYRIVITSDEPTEFLVGRMAFVRDSDPIQANMFVFPPFLEAKRSIFFASRVEAGLTPYEVQWDFDNQAGESVDAVGERVTYTYPAEGLYTITCTVRDKTGAKEPVISKLEVKISRPFEE
ncbi:MAG: PKD domain-containing protein [Armatimonadota bacterium]